ncbi:MAG: prepilin-type N-terminal cleavage/methylation domain-containing protein [Phycisphaerae bacterium]|nr:prepilin-type N-terminal cleavage/methylation domain-containing protein [Phycisphaerae bacterium]
MKLKHKTNGFTFVELLVALIVSGIIFTAVASLAYALGTANDAAGDKAEKQAQVRFATLRISELIRHCKLMARLSYGNGIYVWKDTNEDDQMLLSEEVFIEAGEDGGIQLLRKIDGTTIVLIPECSNVQFQLNDSAMKSKFVSISFDLVENGVSHQYQINAAIRGWAGNLLNDAGTAIDYPKGDDD